VTIKETNHACDALRYALFMNVQGGSGVAAADHGHLKSFHTGARSLQLAS